MPENYAFWNGNLNGSVPSPSCGLKTLCLLVNCEFLLVEYEEDRLQDTDN